MQLGSPIDAVASAVHHAAHVAFPDIHYQDRDWAALEGLSFEERRTMQLDNSYPMVAKVRRPDVSEIQVTAMFPQTWGSTALGFGGMGGAAMTPAYTVVVTGPNGQLAVYWGGRHAYTMDLTVITEQQRTDFDADLAKNWTVNLNEADTRYGAVSSRKSTKQARAEKQARTGTATPTVSPAKPVAKTSLRKGKTNPILMVKPS